MRLIIKDRIKIQQKDLYLISEKLYFKNSNKLFILKVF